MPVSLRANWIGSLAAQALLVESTAAIGEAVAVFTNSFYLRTRSGELVFFTNRPLRSPITVNLDSACSFASMIKALEPIRGDGKEIRLGTDLSIELRNARVQGLPPRMEVRSDVLAEIGNALRTASFLLGIIDTRQSVLDARSIAHGGVAEFARQSVTQLKRADGEGSFREAAKRIVGLGSGFTPSGDDTLGGFLAAYNSLAPAVGRSLVLLEFEALEGKTSWISAKLLDYMQHLVLDEKVDGLIASAVAGDGDAMILAVEALLPRGHTSGIDICVGAILALALMKDVAFATDETDRIIDRLGLR